MQHGYHPVIRFQPEGQKARRAELVPVAPEFAEMLEAIPEAERVGPVFRLYGLRKSAETLALSQIQNLILAITKAARVVVDETTGQYATAHDFRRAFGTRWAKRVMPAVLKRLMRHKDIATTLKFYVDQEVDDIAEDLWAAYHKEGSSNRLGNTSPKNAQNPG